VVEKDGGPAFPCYEPITTLRESGYTEDLVPVGGMSLRDYFAARVLPAIVEGQGVYEARYPTIAKAAYGLADAMLAARQK
jgi:hypothetical protein